MQNLTYKTNQIHNSVYLLLFFGIFVYFLIPSKFFITQEGSLTYSVNTNKRKVEVAMERVRAAVIMEADEIEINGLLYALECEINSTVEYKKARVIIECFRYKLASRQKQKAIAYLNTIPQIVFFHENTNSDKLRLKN